MKNINEDSVDYNQKSITRLETTVMMETTVCITIGIDHYQDGNRCQVRIETTVRMEMSMQVNKTRELPLMHQFCTQYVSSMSLL